MRLKNRNQKTGHLLTLFTKDNRNDNFSFFFPVEGLEQFEKLLKVTQGFESNMGELGNKYEIANYSIADIDCISETIPEVDDARVLIFELEEFLNEDGQFINEIAKMVINSQEQNTQPIFPDIRTGSYATGANFYNRQGQLKDIWAKLEQGKNLILQAPRRYGKSSLLNHMVDNPSSGWNAFFVDLEGAKSSQDFAELILWAIMRSKYSDTCLPRHLSSYRMGTISESSKLEIVREERHRIGEDWKGYTEGLFTAMAPKTQDTRSLLILDEFSWLIEDMLALREQNATNVDEFMTWFNIARQKANRLSFIVSGSEHLPTFLASFGINGHTEDLETVHLGLFDINVAREFTFLALQGQDIVVRQSEIDQILRLIGKPIPFFLQLFVDLLVAGCHQGQNLTKDNIEAAYTQRLLGPESKRNFEGIYRQIDRYERYGPGIPGGALAILNVLAQRDSADKGDLKAIWLEKTENSIDFEIILNILRNDFYVEEHDGKVSFGSKLLKDWWTRHALT